MSNVDRLELSLRLRMRWWALRRWLRRCPECAQRGWDPETPRWEDDPVAQMLRAVTPDRCRGCGRGFGASDEVTS